MYIDSLTLSNPQYMKFYIERGDENMAQIKKQIDVLTKKGVNIKLCAQDKPYLSNHECIGCP